MWSEYDSCMKLPEISCMKLPEIAGLPADTFLADELTNDDGIIEMANLDSRRPALTVSFGFPR
jgi:hypothetical protein